MRIFVCFIIFSGLLFSQEIEVKLFARLFTSLFHKKTVYVYTENKKYQNLQSVFLINVKNCKKADIVLGVSKECKNKPHFLLDYYNYIKDKNALGAFYWRKGRPQLRLRKKIILKYHLYTAPEFEDYLE